jgi:hypothetical protein
MWRQHCELKGFRKAYAHSAAILSLCSRSRRSCSSRHIGIVSLPSGAGVKSMKVFVGKRCSSEQKIMGTMSDIWGKAPIARNFYCSDSDSINSYLEGTWGDGKSRGKHHELMNLSRAYEFLYIHFLQRHSDLMFFRKATRLPSVGAFHGITSMAIRIPRSSKSVGNPVLSLVLIPT